MKITLFLAAILFCLLQTFGQHVQFKGNHSRTWEECINSYKTLDESSDVAKLTVAGKTDGGKPIHLFVINKDKVFHPELFDRKKTIVLINNDIHAGEPDGVDASILFCEEILGKNSSLSALLDSVILCIIPMYNVDGAMVRGKYHRADQVGPEEYGVRANARNLDLNRDFMKCDSRNAQSFAQIFTGIQPHVFIDTHVSNGADYPYTMTLISTQPDKLGGVNGKYLREKMEPALFASMKSKNDEMCPYVNTMGRTPETGIYHFLETPRFATGYAALFQTIGFTSETHMLKPFERRVESTYHFILSVMEYCDAHSNEIIKKRVEADREMQQQKTIAINYVLDTTRSEKLNFSGYEARTRQSTFGKGERMYYDHDAPWSKSIPYYSRFKPMDEISIPDFYIIPQAWHEVIDRLQWNHVQMKEFKSDTTLTLQCYIIEDYNSPQKPYEGHFVHGKVKVQVRDFKINLNAGDVYVSTKQPARRYLAEALEPQSGDSFFAWNFFDSMLQQKEWFSDYVFEEKADELLKSDPKLKKSFEEAVATDAELKDNHWNQLYWIYRHSPYYELTVNRYPVFRFNGLLP